MREADDWDAHWRRYDEAAHRNPAQQMRHRLVLHLLRTCAPADDLRLLDIGSGQGDLLVKVRQAFPAAKLVGVELSESGVEASRRKLPDATFIAADLLMKPEHMEPFRQWANYAVCSEVLEHVDSPGEFLRAARPFLGDDCIVIVTVPGGPMSAFDRHIGHRQHFTRESITCVLEASQFTVDAVYLSGFPFFNLYRLVVIARGDKLQKDVDATRGSSGRLARIVMALFRGLLRLTWRNSPFGWQVIAVARKTPESRVDAADR